MAERTEERVYSVSEITELIKATLEDGFPWITVQGEVSNFRPSSAGHWYFSLKDQEAVLSLVMFRNRLDQLRFTPSDGMLVRATGSVSVYARRGSYQLICEILAKAGEGDILAMLEQRKKRLAAEGLFDLERKKPLPLFPSRVAVVTSPTGAAVRDILHVLRRRNAGIDVVIVPTPVQGEGADERIARAIEAANRWGLGEVIIVGRGGGSLEDLLPFSSEVVVRAIAASRLPVISAVGHETDITLSDLVADVRAPTPSAAAELVAASRRELVAQVRGLADSLESSLNQRLERIRSLLDQFSAENLVRNVGLFLQPAIMRLDDARDSLQRGFAAMADEARHRFELASRELSSYSPLAVLERGYAVVTSRKTGAVLVSSADAAAGDGLGIRLARGGIRAVVEETDAGEKF
ncbi:MAG TPA: exodeoxyribonuclease VII large subunit [Spirochaetia bacterium]|nr:exodeoxyribonuclease VII large subunit [Spirochaetia bacterium]